MKLFMPIRLTGAVEAKFIWFLTSPSHILYWRFSGHGGGKKIRLCREKNSSHPSFTRIISSHSSANLYVNNHNHHYQSTSAGLYVSETKTVHQQRDSCDKWKAQFIKWRQRDGTLNSVRQSLHWLLWTLKQYRWRSARRYCTALSISWQSDAVAKNKTSTLRIT